MSAELPIEINMEVEESEMSFDMEVDGEINVTSVQGTDVTDTTAVEADVKSGKIFHKADGSRATGTAHIPVATDDADVYLTRESPFDADLMRLKKIIGGSICWNQLCDVSKAENTVTRNGVTFTKMGDGSYRLNGTATANTSFTFYAAFPLIAGKKYYVVGYVKLGNNTGYISFAGIKVDSGSGGIYVPSSTVNYNARIDVRSGDSFSNTLMYPMIVDLTSAFGSTIADYVYNLETADVGDGVAWLKALAPFKAFRPYDAGSLLSVKTSAHRMQGFVSGNSDALATCTYPLAGEELRGFLKLDSQNKLYYDGDEYQPDGSIKRNYGIRAYQSGDESDSSVLTDGTNTVYKLSTPTTEASTPYIELQATFPNGTEEFVDDRTISIPVHQESIYYVND